MIVYQTDHFGYFVGTVVADESPLEPGVFLIPGGAFEAAPPAFDAETQRARWSGEGWAVEDIPQPEPEPEPTSPETVEPDPEPVDLKVYAGEVRKTIEEQGVILPTGVAVQSDVESQGKIAQTIQSIDLGLITEPVNWKSASGFVPLMRADLIAVGTVVAQHVQRSFNAEMAVVAGIEAGSIATPAEVDAAFVSAMAPDHPS